MKTTTVDLLMELVAAVGDAADRLPNGELSLHLARAGAAYSGELMIIGRAVNGWGKSGWTPAQLRERGYQEEMVSATLADSELTEAETCKLAWVSSTWSNTNGYNPATSAFWRVARGLLGELSPEARKAQLWPSSLVWSNLYKIAPKARGNPNAELARLQLEPCKELIADELTKFRPKYLVFLTGFWWAQPFLSLPMLEDEPITLKPEYIHRKGLLRIDGEVIGKYVVADHPQGKKEQTWLKHTLESVC
jgi:hypothetical protein